MQKNIMVWLCGLAAIIIGGKKEDVLMIGNKR